MLNKENCLALADYLEHKVTDDQFDMGEWYRTNCETVGCIAGHAVHSGLITDVEFIRHVYKDYTTFSIRYQGHTGSYASVAGDWLGFSGTLKELIFYGDSAVEEFQNGELTRRDAVNILRRLARDGERSFIESCYPDYDEDEISTCCDD